MKNKNISMASSSTDLAKTYQKKTQIEHIKDAPDTYIGGIEADNVTSWTMNETDKWFIRNSVLFLACTNVSMRVL